MYYEYIVNGEILNGKYVGIDYMYSSYILKINNLID